MNQMALAEPASYVAQATTEPAWLRRVLIGLALLFLASFLWLPLAAVHAQAPAWWAARDVTASVAAIAESTEQVSSATSQTVVTLAEMTRTTEDHAGLADDLNRLAVAFQL